MKQAHPRHREARCRRTMRRGATRHLRRRHWIRHRASAARRGAACELWRRRWIRHRISAARRGAARHLRRRHARTGRTARTGHAWPAVHTAGAVAAAQPEWMFAMSRTAAMQAKWHLHLRRRRRHGRAQPQTRSQGEPRPCAQRFQSSARRRSGAVARRHCNPWWVVEEARRGAEESCCGPKRWPMHRAAKRRGPKRSGVQQVVPRSKAASCG